MLKEAALASFVMFLLSIGMIGFRITDITGGLELVSRFGYVFTTIVLTFIGRIALVLMRENRPRPVIAITAVIAIVLAAQLLGLVDTGGALLPYDDPVMNWLVTLLAVGFFLRAVIKQTRGERDTKPIDLGAKVSKASKYMTPLMLLGAVGLPFMPFSDRHILDIAVLVTTYIMLGWGLNIVVGLAGLLDLGYVAFYAVGAYSYALLAQNFDLGFWVCLPFAGIMAAFAGIMLGFPVLRLRGDYLAIVTLGFGEIVRIVLLNWYTFTGGPDGLSDIPRPTLFGLSFTKKAPEGMVPFHEFFGLHYSSIYRVIFLYYLIVALAMLTNIFTLRIRKLPIGRAWEALREDEIACRSLGINPTNTKLTAFSIGAMFAGFAGSFFATRQGFISPESFTFIESAVILAIVVLGGMGSQIGVVIAAVLLVGLPEFFRDLQQYRMLAFGSAMVFIMLWKPSGILAHREPTLRLHPKISGGGN
ncbi:high-affinity branched-chain amino acid ABC transporter permease LivM [Varunaivibrio sulfuroxidans]|nr:high-affinity branched-chain amino acid ABC transporter permease LivM [Varunaivibrio sulfuroxidans]WES32155.1 high-affinity branched-chain amino acid ABC transporter permease LivM [Varunaivibrio sulfuroxidans]